MTREARRDETRQRLLEAASRLIASKGLDASSVEEIAAEAGYTRGAFYSNFEDKASLLLAIMEKEQQRVTAELETMFGADLPTADFERSVLHYYMTIYRDGACFMPWMEAKLLSIRDPSFRERMRGALLETQSIITRFVNAYHERTGRPATIPAEQLALGLMSLCEGLQFAHMADPQVVPGEAVEAVLSHYFEASIQKAG